MGGAQGTHDFDLVLADGGVIAVEVTSATDEDMERLRGESERRYPAPGLAATWAVFLSKDPRQKLKTLMPELPPLLAVLEWHGVQAIGHGVQEPEDSEVAEAAARIAALGVHAAWRGVAPEPGEDATLALVLSGYGASDLNLLNALVADCAENKRKVLSHAEADARHLFVWVRQTDAWMHMTDLPSPPLEAPDLPPPIDVAWAATSNAVTGLGKLYRLERGGSWEAL